MSDDEEMNVNVNEKNDNEEEEEADIAEMLDLSKKKKKAKKKSSSSSSKKDKKSEDDVDDKDKDNDTNDPSSSNTTNTNNKNNLSEQRQLLLEQDSIFEHNHPDPHDLKGEYTYTDLLDRIVAILHSQNPDLIEKKRRNMKPPQLTRIGTKKTLWINFQEICTMMQRPPEHVFTFFMAELGTEGSIDGNSRLVIRGKYVPKYIESLLRKYIVEYVTCQMCRSPNTELVKDSSTRLQFCNCKDCGSSRSVAAIRTGYHATSRADRRAARNAMA